MLTFSEVSLSFRNEREAKKLPGIDKVWDYLAKRGIDRETADKCGLHIMQAVELIAAARKSPNVNAVDNRAAVVFPHWKLGSEEPIEWWSARLVNLLDSPVKLVASFGDIVDQTKIRTPGKMFCPPNEAPHGYLPPIYSWASLARDDKIYIHESALKSLNGAILGFPSVGLNGVWGWSSRKHGIALIEELRDLPWKAKNLQPVIVFDSNAWDNWQVQQAETYLAAKLFEITGQRSVSLRVPKDSLSGDDQGFDDYRARNGDVAARAFLEGKLTGYEFVEVEISELQQLMIQLNSEVCVVRELGRVADQTTGDLMTRAVFTDVNYAHFTAEVSVGEDVKTVNVPKIWIADPKRVEVQSLEYKPGQPRLIPTALGIPNLNLWKGMGCDPDPGDVEPWLELLANNVPDDELRQWLIAWCAYPLQNLGAKMTSYPLIFGPSGTGKNLFFKPLHHIYGRNAVVISREHVSSTFNSVYSMKQFVHVDEIKTQSGVRDNVAQKIKLLISQERMVVNRKGQPEFEVDASANFAITDNFWDCMKLDQDDRRACVIRWEGAVDRRGDQPYWSKYVHWAEHWGPSFLYDWLLKQDISWFDPTSWAPATKWKEQVKEATMLPLESWIKDLWDDPSGNLPIISASRALWTAKELAVLFHGQGENELSPGQIKAVANGLRNHGFHQANDNSPVRRPGGQLERFWVIQRRGEKWDSKMCVAHLKA
jgi:putative DNA primase/helicase